MRLVCPGCGAQYEIDDELIPPTGRDVQCSACGHAFFQHHPSALPATSPDADVVPKPVSYGADVDGASPSARAEQAPAVSPPRRIDPEVLDVLRQEAEFEERARRAEAETIETQPDLGLGPTQPQAPSPSARRGRLAETTPEPTGSAAMPYDPARPASRATAGNAPAQTADERTTDRGGILPDIESISSTLNPEARDTSRSSTSPPDDAESDAAGRSGFVRGFMLVLGVMILALALYVGAPALSEAAPGLAPALEAYVAAIDRAHMWTVDTVNTALGWVLERLNG